MADADWFPGAFRDPGLNAGYRRGQNLNRIDVAHYTVGRDSRALIRDRGLAHFLYPKFGPPIQFAEANAICSHACEFNDDGLGHEVERMGDWEPFTPDQIRWVGEVVRWRNARYGVPLAHHARQYGRLPTVTSFRGVADHGGLTHYACDQHTDGWWPHEWAAAIGSASTPSTPSARKRGSDCDMIQVRVTGNRFYRVFPANKFRSGDWLCVGVNVGQLDGYGNPSLAGHWLQNKAAGVPTIDGGGGGVSQAVLYDEIRSIASAQNIGTDDGSIATYIKP